MTVTKRTIKNEKISIVEKNQHCKPETIAMRLQSVFSSQSCRLCSYIPLTEFQDI